MQEKFSVVGRFLRHTELYGERKRQRNTSASLPPILWLMEAFIPFMVPQICWKSRTWLSILSAFLQLCIQNKFGYAENQILTDWQHNPLNMYQKAKRENTYVIQILNMVRLPPVTQTSGDSWSCKHFLRTLLSSKLKKQCSVLHKKLKAQTTKAKKPTLVTPPYG